MLRQALSFIIAASLTAYVSAETIPSVQFTLDSSNMLEGGLEHGHTLRGLLDFSIETRTDAIEGATFFAQALIQQGDQGSELAGDIQGYSNIDSDDFESVFEIWYGQSLLNKQLTLKLGWLDGNSDFAATDHGGQFINSSMGFSPTVFAMPTYPDTVLAINAVYDITQSQQVAFGVYDGQDTDDFSEQFFISQFKHNFTDTTLRLGAWQHSQSSEQRGWFASLDQVLPSNWALLSQLGISHEGTVEIDQHASIGLVKYQSFEREQDISGFAISSAHVQAQRDKETAYEYFYHYQVNKHLSLKPDLQYIHKPSADNSIDDALIFTLRLVANL
jgi:carbohydrate-selective porin OprB